MGCRLATNSISNVHTNAFGLEQYSVSCCYGRGGYWQSKRMILHVHSSFRFVCVAGGTIPAIPIIRYGLGAGRRRIVSDASLFDPISLLQSVPQCNISISPTQYHYEYLTVQYCTLHFTHCLADNKCPSAP